MPVWHDALRKPVQDGRLVLLGVTQEQHADRCRLFAQWKGFDWPILHDPINVLEPEAVPIWVAIDEHGIVRQLGPTLEAFQNDFLNRQFREPDDDELPSPLSPRPENMPALQQIAQKTGTARAWRELGDALFLWGDPEQLNPALKAYQEAHRLDPEDGPTGFRLGVCYRKRYESNIARAGDFQKAIDHWERALHQQPNQYIWRRRIQQYGPRPEKPYPFYDWAEQAKKDILDRGERPVELTVTPSGAEIARPARRFQADSTGPAPPDPHGRIHRDRHTLIETEITVVPARIAPGESARVHIAFQPDPVRKVHWNNESEPLRLWVDAPEGWHVSRHLLQAPQGEQAETNEVRRLDFEVQAPLDANGPVRLPAYALYYVCEELGGSCRFLRQDLPVTILVDGNN